MVEGDIVRKFVFFLHRKNFTLKSLNALKRIALVLLRGSFQQKRLREQE
jgi:hypothetical protein